MELSKLSKEEQNEFKRGIIKVYGKAMNRTALGIIAAYFKLYPNTTYKELKNAFPDNLIPTGQRQPKSIFKPYTNRDFGIVHSLSEIKKDFDKAGLPYKDLFFLNKDEMFKTSDGVTVVVKKSWASKNIESGKNELEILAERATTYGIIVAGFEERKHFTKGSYRLEILNELLFEKISISPEKTEKVIVKEKIISKNVIPIWVWIVLGLAIIILILWLLDVFNSEPKIIEKQVVKEVEVIKTDTIFVKEIESISAKFNAVQFEKGETEIPEEAKYALYDLAKLLGKNPDVFLEIEGHTSVEGNQEFNQELSENRAKTVFDFLIKRGVDEDRLSYIGKGSSEPIDSANPEINRRTEFIIIE
jgi:outer membrane protein OmpA-like peptidoglycan-associated protein